MSELSALAPDLASSTREFIASFEGLSPAQWAYRPTPGKWSIAETAEHTAVVLRGIERLCRGPLLGMPITGEENRPRVTDAQIVTALDEGGRDLPAPERVLPKGRWATAAEVAAAMQASSDELVAWAQSTEADPRAVAAPHPLFGPIDGVQWVLMVTAHSRRHARQIVALRKSAPELA